MIKKVLAVAALAAVAGLLVYLYFGVLPVPNILQSIWAKIQEAYTAIPEPIKGFLQVISIPSLISGIFFAWTKIRAMNQLQQTKLEASKQITQLEGEKGELEQQVKQSATQGIEELVKSRDEAQELVIKYKQDISGFEQQIRDMQNRHLGEISSLQARLDKYEPKEVIRVK